MTKPWIDGELLAVDLETTGLDVAVDKPVSFALARKTVRNTIESESWLIDPGVPIPPEVTEIHGITDEMVKAEGLDMETAINKILAAIVDAHVREVPVVGMNVAFDLSMIDACTVACGLPGGLGWYTGPVLDILVLDKKYDKWRPGSRNLAALCAHYQVDPGDSHDARADAIASLRVLRAMVKASKWYRYRSPQELHTLQGKWRLEQLEDLSQYRKSQGDSAVPSREFGWPLYLKAGNAG